jgi:hypothetical protein
MAQHKAEGIALSEAAQYVNKQAKVLEKLPTDLLAQDLQRYTIVGGQSFPKDNLEKHGVKSLNLSRKIRTFGLTVRSKGTCRLMAVLKVCFSWFGGFVQTQ